MERVVPAITRRSKTRSVIGAQRIRMLPEIDRLKVTVMVARELLTVETGNRNLPNARKKRFTMLNRRLALAFGLDEDYENAAAIQVSQRLTISVNFALMDIQADLKLALETKDFESPTTMRARGCLLQPSTEKKPTYKHGVPERSVQRTAVPLIKEAVEKQRFGSAAKIAHHAGLRRTMCRMLAHLRIQRDSQWEIDTLTSMWGLTESEGSYMLKEAVKIAFTTARLEQGEKYSRTLTRVDIFDFPSYPEWVLRAAELSFSIGVVEEKSARDICNQACTFLTGSVLSALPAAKAVLTDEVMKTAARNEIAKNLQEGSYTSAEHIATIFELAEELQAIKRIRAIV